jgi:hypothetical protein
MLLVCGEIVVEGRDELPSGALEGLDIEGEEDLHASVPHHGDKVLVEPMVQEEFFTNQLREQHDTRADPLVVLVEDNLQRITLNTRALGILL